MSDALDRLIEAMSDPGFYPHRPKAVEVIHTHISVVFIADELVYKIKKPVYFDFLDFTTPEKRKYYCCREVLLNSRFSHGIYIGTVPVCRDESGINLEERGEEIDTAVLMNRIPDEKILAHMLEQDQVTDDMLRRLAGRIAQFHGEAATDEDVLAFGSMEAVRGNLEENLSQTEPFIGRTIDASMHDEIGRRAKEFLDAHTDLLARRVGERRIRDCHGDLKLDHVVVLDEIMLIDCIEFNDRFRYGDTASDLAFLLMGLNSLGFPAYAALVADRYAVEARDDTLQQILPYYQSYRAFVRGKVLSFELDEPEISQEEKETAREKARSFFSLALSFFKPPPPPALIVMHGLTGTGKSYLAEKLGRRLGIEPIRSDVVRKELFSMPETQHELDKFGEGFYTSSATDATYTEIMARAARSLREGRSAILDASFIYRKHRAAACELASRYSARFRIVECTCPESVVRQRLIRRMAEGTDPSEGRWEIYREQRTVAEDIDERESTAQRTWNSE
jgi:hypothetical protein